MKVISQYVIIFRYIVLNLSQTYVSLKMYFYKAQNKYVERGNGYKINYVHTS